MIFLMIGPSGSGKSYFARKLNAQLYDESILISSDSARAVIGRGEEDQSVNRQVFEWINYTCEYILKYTTYSVIVDSCALTHEHRDSFIKLAKMYNKNIRAFVFTTSIEQCKINNMNRERKVPDYVIDKQFKILSFPLLADGFDRIEYIKFNSE